MVISNILIYHIIFQLYEQKTQDYQKTLTQKIILKKFISQQTSKIKNQKLKILKKYIESASHGQTHGSKSIAATLVIVALYGKHGQR